MSGINLPTLPYWLGQFPPIDPYGSFTSLANQKVAGANIATPLTYTTTELASNIYYTGSKVYVQDSGVFRVLFTIQMSTISGGINSLNIWLRRNGVNVKNTNSFYSLSNNAFSLAVCELLVELQSGDYIEIVFQSADANMTASYVAAAGTPPNNYPDTPSIILNINKIA